MVVASCGLCLAMASMSPVSATTVVYFLSESRSDIGVPFEVVVRPSRESLSEVVESRRRRSRSTLRHCNRPRRRIGTGRPTDVDGPSIDPVGPTGLRVDAPARRRGYSDADASMGRGHAGTDSMSMTDPSNPPKPPPMAPESWRLLLTGVPPDLRPLAGRRLELRRGRLPGPDPGSGSMDRPRSSEPTGRSASAWPRSTSRPTIPPTSGRVHRPDLHAVRRGRHPLRRPGPDGRVEGQ